MSMARKISLLIAGTAVLCVIIYLLCINVNDSNTVKNKFVGNNDILMWNTSSAKYNEKINNTICYYQRDRGLDKYIMCHGNVGYFFENSTDDSKKSELKIRSFVNLESTRIIKEANSSLVRFVNESDTLIVKYEVMKENWGLIDGVIVK